jgi:curli biogenesis system outer membrane secretion channel CsgG
MAQSGKPKLAVKILENPAADAKSMVGDALSEILFAELNKAGRFVLIGKPEFDKAANGIDFSMPDWFRKDSTAGTDRLAGADFLLIGKVGEFSFVETPLDHDVKTARGKEGQRDYKQDAMVRLDFHIVSAATGDTIMTDTASDSRTAYSAASDMARFTRLQKSGFTAGEAQDSLIGRTAVAACQKAVRKILDSQPLLVNHLLKSGKKTTRDGQSMTRDAGRETRDRRSTMLISFCRETRFQAPEAEDFSRGSAQSAQPPGSLRAQPSPEGVIENN